jgi:arginase
LSAQVGRDLGDAATTITSTHRDADTGVLALPDTVRAARTLTDRLAAALVNLPGQRPLVVGGDCSILLGIVPALRARGLVSLWFLDGHPDFLDGAASETGETADMELAVLTGSGAAPLVELAGPAPMTPMVPVERVVLLGHRAENFDDASAAELVPRPPTFAPMLGGQRSACPKQTTWARLASGQALLVCQRGRAPSCGALDSPSERATPESDRTRWPPQPSACRWRVANAAP